RQCAGKARALAEAVGYLVFQARASAVLAAALERGGRDSDADTVLEEGRRLLDRAAARIQDPKVRADFLQRPVFEMLRSNDTIVARRHRGRLAALYDMIRVLNSES